MILQTSISYIDKLVIQFNPPAEKTKIDEI